MEYLHRQVRRKSDTERLLMLLLVDLIIPEKGQTALPWTRSLKNLDRHGKRWKLWRTCASTFDAFFLQGLQRTAVDDSVL
jgi:hypothetical protein